MEQLVSKYTCGPDIHFVTVSPLKHLWSLVEDGACRRCPHLVFVFVLIGRYTEVDKLNAGRVERTVENVFWFDVPMTDALTMQIVNSFQ